MDTFHLQPLYFCPSSSRDEEINQRAEQRDPRLRRTSSQSDQEAAKDPRGLVPYLQRMGRWE